MALRLIMVFFVMLLAVSAEGQATEEYQVKAAFLYNFAKFVQWPSSAFKNAQEPIAICILGTNPFGDALDEAIRGKQIEGRSLVVYQVSSESPSHSCHILFVGASERKRFRNLAEAFRAPGILTVGEAAWFGSEGGVINLKLDSGRVRFEINADAADRQQLRISSKLLSLAQVVNK
jgi:YfiR/HmsC-like